MRQHLIEKLLFDHIRTCFFLRHTVFTTTLKKCEQEMSANPGATIHIDKEFCMKTSFKNSSGSND